MDFLTYDNIDNMDRAAVNLGFRFNVPFGEADSYIFDENDFQQLVGTEDSIYVIEGENTLFSIISNMTLMAAIVNILVLIVFSALVLVVFFNFMSLTIG